MTQRKPLYFTCSVFLAALALGWAGTGTAAAGDFPATGQTRCWNNSGKRIACAGTGQDGEIQAGRTLRYKDKGNGTIEDQNTGLVWEKKSDDDSIHDTDNAYTWDDTFDVHVATLNNICAKDESVDCSVNGDADCAGVGGKCGFAGERDWRVPNHKELTSILNLKNALPAVSRAFHNNNCVPGATVLTGSCTPPEPYWSSTTFPNYPLAAWFVNFNYGGVASANKTIDGYGRVRAVRGASDFPATGQTTVYHAGDDGDIQAGATLAYRDNGNGTIKDRNTKLVWEKKSDDDGIHDKDNTYTPWKEAFDVHVFTLNNTCAKEEMVDCSVSGDAACVAAGVGGKCGFAGKRDWRVPNHKELTSILNLESSPVVSAAFNNNCVPGATVLTGSCTPPSFYWSSTTSLDYPRDAWFVAFGSGGASIYPKKFGELRVRAVRGGSP